MKGWKKMKMYVNLEFDLPDDEYDYRTWNKAENYRRALSEFFAELRLRAKHNGELGSYDSTYELLWGYLKDNDLTWEDLV